MFDQTQYVPILKCKGGELWAVSRLQQKTRELITPLFELKPVPQLDKKQRKAGKKPKSLSTHLDEQCKSLLGAWGNEQPLFIDARWLLNVHGPDAVSIAFSAARSYGLRAIPVVHTSDPNDVLQAAKAVHRQDSRGVLVRVKPGAKDQECMPGVLKSLGAAFSDLDLMLDYGGQPMELQQDVSQIAQLSKWRTFSAASGVFPKSVSERQPKRWHEIERACWSTYLAGLGRKLARQPAFSDYAGRFHGAPAGGGDPLVSLRYTFYDYWLVMNAGYWQQGDAANMKVICKKLMRREEYCKKKFSAGDEAIFKTGRDPGETPGTPGQWAAWSINHHLEYQVLVHRKHLLRVA